MKPGNSLQANVGIALFTRDLHADGAPRSTLELAKQLSGTHRVDLLLLRRAGPLMDEVPPEVRVVELGGNRLSRVRPAFGAVGAMATYLRRERPRFFVSGMTSYNMAAVAAAKLAGYRGRLVLIERNSPSVKTTGSGAFRLAKRLGTKLAYERADTLMAVSHGAARDLERFAWLRPNSVTGLYNAVDVEGIRRLAEQPVDLNLPNDGPVIVHASRLNPVKDPETLIRAFALINARMKASFLIVGGDRDLGFLDKWFAEAGDLRRNTVFTGFVRNPFPYMARGDVFVLSSRAEGFARVIVESFALGVPVVSTDCPSGPRELLRDGELGTLVPVGDAEALANATMATLNVHDAERLERLRRLTSHAEQFTSSAIAGAFAEVIGLDRLQSSGAP